MDTNHDGVVDLKEFMAAGGSKEEFNQYDLDGDGVLSVDEISKLEFANGEDKLKGRNWIELANSFSESSAPSGQQSPSGQRGQNWREEADTEWRELAGGGAKELSKGNPYTPPANTGPANPDTSAAVATGTVREKLGFGSSAPQRV